MPSAREIINDPAHKAIQMPCCCSLLWMTMLNTRERITDPAHKPIKHTDQLTDVLQQPPLNDDVKFSWDNYWSCTQTNQTHRPIKCCIRRSLLWTTMLSTRERFYDSAHKAIKHTPNKCCIRRSLLWTTMPSACEIINDPAHKPIKHTDQSTAVLQQPPLNDNVEYSWGN